MNKRRLVEIVLFAVMIGFISVAFAIIDMGLSLSISSVITDSEITADQQRLEAIETVNSLFLNTEQLRNDIRERSGNYEYLFILGPILMLLMVLALLFARKFFQGSKELTEEFFKKTKIFSNHTELAFSVFFAIFIALSLFFLSSTSFLTMNKEQTIYQMVALSINNPQPEIVLKLLEEYLSNAIIDYFFSFFSFVYFLILAIFPLIGLLLYRINHHMKIQGVSLTLSFIPGLVLWINLFS